jgi:hypothetical protein
MSIATRISTFISMAHSFLEGGGGVCVEYGVGIVRINRSKGFVHSHSVSSQILFPLLLPRHALLVILAHSLHQFACLLLKDVV